MANPISDGFDVEQKPQTGGTQKLQTVQKTEGGQTRDKWQAKSFDSVSRNSTTVNADGTHEYLAVSCGGGGARSQGFCTGVLAALYERDDVTVTAVSGVSGGTWASVGLELWRQAAIDSGQDPRASKEWIYEFILHTTDTTTGATL